MNNLRKRASRIIQLHVLLVAALLLTPSSAYAREVIKNFEVDARVLKDTATVDVNESITIDFGHHSRHGLERVYGPSQQIKVESVVDNSGTKYETSVSTPDGKTKLRIGSPKKTVVGVNTYKIHYTVGGAITSDGVLNWSPTGHQWKQAIQKFQLRLNSDANPTSVSAKTNSKPQYLPIDNRGIYYLNAKDGGVFHINASNLSPGNGVDVAVNLGYHPTISTSNNSTSSFNSNDESKQSSSSFSWIVAFLILGPALLFFIAWFNSNSSLTRQNGYGSTSSCGSSWSSCGSDSGSSSSCSSSSSCGSSCGGGDSW